MLKTQRELLVDHGLPEYREEPLLVLLRQSAQGARDVFVARLPGLAATRLRCLGGTREGIKVIKEAERKRRILATEPGKERVGTPLGAARIDPRDIEEIVVEFDEGKEVITHKINERFGSYNLDEAARYIFFLSNHIAKGGY